MGMVAYIYEGDELKVVKPLNTRSDLDDLYADCMHIEEQQHVAEIVERFFDNEAIIVEVPVPMVERQVVSA